MACRTCKAAAGTKCRDFRGREVDTICSSRMKDFNKLLELEAKMQQLNRDYGKAISQ
jgi:hypothetical protein